MNYGKFLLSYFEILVAELLTADGWDIELVARNNAPGPDIIAISTKLIRNVTLKLIVECKRYSENNPVDIDVVRKIMYWVNKNAATMGMIATTSRFTSAALKQAKKIPRVAPRFERSICNYPMAAEEHYSTQLSLNPGQQFYA